MGDAATHISLAATGQSQAVTGKVTISATNLMATHYLPPILRQIKVRAPTLQIEIVTSNKQSDLRRREADIAIRHARPQDENLFAKRIRDTTAHLFASTQYLNEVGRPVNASDLTKMHFIGFDHPEQRLELMASRGIDLTTENFNFITASGTLSVELIRQGLGIGILPIEVGETYPELENPFPAFEPIQVETWLVVHRELRTSSRIRLVFNLLSENLAK